MNDFSEKHPIAYAVLKITSAVAAGYLVGLLIGYTLLEIPA